MGADIGSIAFLAIFALVPVGMVTGIIILIARKAGGKSELKAACARQGWSLTGESREGAEALRAQLEPTLFAGRSGQHRLTSVRSCTDGGARMWVAEYHYRHRTTVSGSQRGGTYSVLVIPRNGTGPELMVHHRQKGALAAAAGRLAGDRLVSASVEGWSWALVSSDQALKEYPHSIGVARRLGETTEPGDNVFFYPGLTMWVRPGTMRRNTARMVPELAELLRQFN